MAVDNPAQYVTTLQEQVRSLQAQTERANLRALESEAQTRNMTTAATECAATNVLMCERLQQMQLIVDASVEWREWFRAGSGLPSAQEARLAQRVDVELARKAARS